MQGHIQRHHVAARHLQYFILNDKNPIMNHVESTNWYIRRVYLIVLLTLASIQAFSQEKDFDGLMKERAISCIDVIVNATELFEQFVFSNELDSAKRLLNYWQGKCDLLEPIYRAKTILSMHNGGFNETTIETKHIQYFFAYRSLDKFLKESDIGYNNYTAAYFDYIPPNSNFNTLLTRMAGDILAKSKKGTSQYLIASLYAGQATDDFFVQLYSEEYRQTHLGQVFQEHLNDSRLTRSFHWAGTIGIWMPKGEIEILGNHPNIGFVAGIRKNGWNYDFDMNFKFLRTRNTYLAQRKNSNGPAEETRQFFGGYLGVGIGRDIYADYKNEFQLITGLGLDGFDALREEDNLKATSILTYNFNIGLSYKHIFNYSTYIGFKARWNFTDYTLSKVVDYSGNPITFDILIGTYEGGIFNYFKKTKKRKR